MKENIYIFNKISRYWNDQLNNEIYLKNHSGILRGTREYFDIIISARKKYMYYFDKIVNFLGINGKGKKMLEVGCGMGTDLLSFAKLNYQVYGIDLADEHIKLSKKCFDLYSQSAEIKCGNAEQLKFSDNSFDMIYSFGVIHHTPNPDTAISEIYRVLKTGGKCFLMLYNKYSLNNLVHIILRYPFENPKKSTKVAKDTPFTYRFSKREVKKMCSEFSSVNIKVEYLFGAGWGKAFDIMPKTIYRFLSKLMGWHLLIFLKK